MAQRQSTQDAHALVAEFSSEIQDIIDKSDRSAIVAELKTNIWRGRRSKSKKLKSSSGSSRGRPAKAPRTLSSSTNKENNNNNGTTTAATASSSSSLQQSQNESSSGESSSSNVGGDRQDMDVDHVDFTGSGGGGDVDMIDDDHSNTGDTASTTDDSAVTLNGRTLPHVRKVARLPSPHNQEDTDTEDEDGTTIRLEDKLASFIIEYCKEHKIDLKKMLPRGTPAMMIASFEKKTKLKVPSKQCWNSAVSIARDGKALWGGDENGLSHIYSRSAQVKGTNGKGFAATFPNGNEGAKQFCANYFESKDVMDEFLRLRGTGLDHMESFRRMKNVMPKNQATKIVLSVFHEYLQIDYTQINDDNAHEILRKVSEMELDISLFNFDPDDEDKENMSHVLESVALDGKVKVTMAITWVQKGLAFQSTRLYANDEGGEDECDDLYLPAPAKVPKQDCQGKTKQLRGNPLDFETFLETSGDLIIGLASAVVINSNSGIGKDGYTYTVDPSKPIFREIIINPRDREKDGKGKGYWSLGVTKDNNIVQVHQLHQCVTAAFGASVYHECHYKSGGILEGVLKKGQTWNKRFDCTIKKGRKESIVKAYGKKHMPNQCDGDHLFGRTELYLNGFLLVQQTPHQENIVRAWVRSRSGEWLHPLIIGKYKGGKIMPAEWEDREL